MSNETLSTPPLPARTPSPQPPPLPARTPTTQPPPLPALTSSPQPPPSPSSHSNHSHRSQWKKSWTQFKHLDEEAHYAEICLLSEPALVRQHAIMQRKLLGASVGTGACIGGALAFGPGSLLSAPISIRWQNVNGRRVGLIEKRLNEMGWEGYKCTKRDYLIPAATYMVGSMVPPVADKVVGHASTAVATSVAAKMGSKVVVSGVRAGVKTGVRLGMQKVAYRREEAIIMKREVAEGEGRENEGEGGVNKEEGGENKEEWWENGEEGEENVEKWWENREEGGENKEEWWENREEGGENKEEWWENREEGGENKEEWWENGGEGGENEEGEDTVEEDPLSRAEVVAESDVKESYIRQLEETVARPDRWYETFLLGEF